MSKTKVEIIYQDDDVLVINKPTGVSVTKDRTGAPELTDILADQLGPQICSRLRLVHRLDKDTSGVMLLAKNAETQSRFSSYFEKRLVKKIYLAFVTGVLTDRQGTINAPLSRNKKNTELMRITAKKGSTRPLYLSYFKPDYRLAKDQIEKPLIERLTLHAYQLSFRAEPKAESRNLIGNSSNRPECFIAALDKKIAATIKMLTKHNPKSLDAFINPNDFSKIINAQKLDLLFSDS